MTDVEKKKVTSVEVLRDIVALKPNGETRIQQEQMVEAIEDAIENEEHILVEGPTGSGKSLSYLLPAIISGKKIVVSTATKQLSEQLNDNEMPFIQKALIKTHPELIANDYTLLKGRDNYLCKKKEDDQLRLNAQGKEQQGNMLDAFNEPSAKGAEMSAQMNALDEWSAETRTGDRSEAPAVPDETWKLYSSTSSECPGSICPFYEACFAEKAREKARSAQVVITNHAVVARDLMSDSDTGSLLGERDVVVFDELHELDNYLSKAWGATLTLKQIDDIINETRKTQVLNDGMIKSAQDAFKKLEVKYNTAQAGLITQMSPALSEDLKAIQKFVINLVGVLAKSNKKGGEKLSKQDEAKASLGKRATELADSFNLVLDEGKDTVRWFNVPEAPKFQKRGAAKTEIIVSLNAAPLRIGPKLQASLEQRNITMVGASATVRVTGSFEIPVHNFALDVISDHKTLAVDSPFDFPKQGMIYIPSKEFPAPTGADRVEHRGAAQQETLDLVLAAGGRALVLTTTTFDANSMAEFLREKLKRKKIKVLLQGDAPQKQLIEDFTNEETSVLVATMGLWHGVDVQGPSLSLVVMTKIPFKPMDDPLALARKNYAEESGRNGFMDVYVADANVMLAQGAGRLVRHSGDKGVVAILDTRLLTKPYGRSMMKSLPAMKIFTNKEIVISALKRLTNNADK